jgi:hypothetical protein
LILVRILLGTGGLRLGKHGNPAAYVTTMLQA